MILSGSLPEDFFLLGVIFLLRLPLADFLARLRGGEVLPPELAERARLAVDLRADFLVDFRADFLLGIVRAVTSR